jgi:hypothetical protein
MDVLALYLIGLPVSFVISLVALLCYNFTFSEWSKPDGEDYIIYSLMSLISSAIWPITLSCAGCAYIAVNIVKAIKNKDPKERLSIKKLLGIRANG